MYVIIQYGLQTLHQPSMGWDYLTIALGNRHVFGCVLFVLDRHNSAFLLRTATISFVPKCFVSGVSPRAIRSKLAAPRLVGPSGPPCRTRYPITLYPQDSQDSRTRALRPRRATIGTGRKSSRLVAGLNREFRFTACSSSAARRRQCLIVRGGSRGDDATDARRSRRRPATEHVRLGHRFSSLLPYYLSLRAGHVYLGRAGAVSRCSFPDMTVFREARGRSPRFAVLWFMMVLSMVRDRSGADVVTNEPGE